MHSNLSNFIPLVFSSFLSFPFLVYSHSHSSSILIPILRVFLFPFLNFFPRTISIAPFSNLTSCICVCLCILGYCVSCTEPIIGMENGCVALEQTYHIKCFMCSKCGELDLLFLHYSKKLNFYTHLKPSK